MNCNEKGVKGLIKVLDDLQGRGYYTFIVFDDHSPIDLIAVDKTGKLIRLQVKYRKRCIKNKTIRYELLASSVVNGKRVSINRNMIDGWAVYLKEDNIVKYISKDFMKGKGQLSIHPKNNYGDLI